MLNYTSKDKTKELIVPGSLDETILFAAYYFILLGQQAIEAHDSFFVALSGGSTPQEIYKKISESPLQEQLDWSKVHLFFSDERAVPLNDPQSNYYAAMESGFGTLPIPPEQIYPMRADIDIQKNALAYEELIKNTLKKHPFDLIMLGIGEDGHTASLFPETAAVQENEKAVVANFLPTKSLWRMTFTLPLINSAKTALVLLSGNRKAKILHEIFENNDSYCPAAKIGTPVSPSLWIADNEAASLIVTAL